MIIILIGMVNAATLYVNQSHPSCNDAYNRGNASNIDTPWCEWDTLATASHIGDGDVVYMIEGNYNDNYGIEIDLGGVSTNWTLTNYQGGQVNISSYAPAYAVVDNGLWQNISAVFGEPNTWNTTYAALSTSQPIIQFANGSEFINSECWNATGCGTAEPAYFIMYDQFYRVWANDTSNEIRVKMIAGENPNNVSLMIAEEANSIRLRNGNPSGFIKIANLTFQFHRRALRITNCSNLIIEHNNFDEGHQALQFDEAPTGGSTIRFNDIWGHHGLNFYEVFIKNAYEESDPFYGAMNSPGAAYIYNNTFHDTVGGISTQSDDPTDACGSEVYNNLFNNSNAGWSSVLEIEPYCCNSSFYNNRIFGGRMSGISLGGANSTTNMCHLHHNIVKLNDYEIYDNDTTYETYALKVYYAVGTNVVNWNITQNTFVAKAKGWNGLHNGTSEYNLTVTNNIFDGNSSVSSSFVFGTGLASRGNFWNHNLYNNRSSVVGICQYNNITPKSPCYKTITLAKASSDWDGTWDINSSQSDPLFTDIGNYNLTPANNSPACSMSSTGSYVGALPCAGVNDSTPPGNITNLSSPFQGESWIFINWSDPVDADFNHTEVFRNETSIANLSVAYLNDTGLLTLTGYVYRLVPVDDSGNRGNNESLTNSTLDLTNPTVNLLNSSFNTTDTTPSVSFNFSDSVSDTSSCVLYFNGSSKATNASVINNTLTIFTSSILSSLGRYEVYVNCTDGSSNIGQSSIINITLQDTALPTVNILNSSFNTTSTTPSISFNFSDAWSGDASCSLYFNGSSKANNASVINDTLTVLVSSALTSLGRYEVYVNCTDASNNIGKSSTINITLQDAVSPTTNILNSSFNTSDSTPGISFNYTDSWSSSASCSLYFNDTLKDSNVSVINNTLTILTSSVLTTLGRYEAYINCTDNSSNIGESSIINVTLQDAVSPTVNLLNSSFNTTSTTPSISFNFTDSVSATANCSLYFNNVSYASNSSVLNNTLTVLTSSTIGGGTYTAFVNCTDESGNIGKSSEITIINTIPFMINVSINTSTSSTIFYDNEILKGWCNANSTNGSNIGYYYRWYLNGIINNTGNSGMITHYNTFNNTLTEENLSFSINQNITRYLTIPKDESISSASINISYTESICNNCTSNPSFELNTNWTYSESDTDFIGNYTSNPPINDYISCGAIPNWTANGNRSYALIIGGRQDPCNGSTNIKGYAGINDYNQITQNINFSKFSSINFTINMTDNFGFNEVFQFWVGSNLLLNITGSTEQSYNLDISPYSGIQTAKFKIHFNDPSCSGCGSTGRTTIFIDNIIAKEDKNVTNPYLEIGTPDNNYEWNYSGNYFIEQITNDLSSIINSTKSICNCSGCINTTNNCTIPFLFHNDNEGIIKYSDININLFKAVYTPGTLVNINNISKTDLFENQNWTLSCSANDGTDNSSWMNSSQITITAHTYINITNPVNGSNTSSNTMNITYELLHNTTANNISYYNISLLNSDGSFNNTIIGNNSVNENYYWTGLLINNSAGTYMIRIDAINSTGDTFATGTTTFNITTDAILNITAIDNVTGTPISNFSITLTFLTSNTSTTLNSTNNATIFGIFKNNNYTIRFISDAYNQTINYESNNSNYQTVILNIMFPSQGLCNPGETPSLFFNLLDEEDMSVLTGTFNYNFNVTIGETNYLVYGNITSTNLSLCINASSEQNWNVNNGEVQYFSSGYVDRRYYVFSGTRISNETTNITLYDLNSSSATVFGISATAQDLEIYDNNYVTLVRWYPELNEYNIVDMGRTDDLGNTVLYVETNDVDYRMGIYELDGTLIYLASPIRMICYTSPCNYNLKSIISSTTSLSIVENIQYSLTFNETTSIWSFTFNDPSQTTQTMNFSVYKLTGNNEIEICNNHVSAYTGAISCNTSGYTGTLKGVVKRSASPFSSFITKIVSVTTSSFKSGFGLFITLLIAIPIIFIFVLINPYVALAGGVIAIIPGLYFGSLSITLIGAVTILAVIVAHFIRNNTR